MCRKNSSLLLLLILLFTASCSTAPSSPGDKAPLTGMVYDTEGRPVQGARVLIDGSEETSTDLNGRFVTPPLKTGAHLLAINREGYEHQRTQVEFTSPLEVLYVSIASFESLIKEAEEQLDLGNHDEALSRIERAETVYPDDPALMVLRCAVYHRSGQMDKAAECSLELKGIDLN